MPWETFDKRSIPMIKSASVTIQAKGVLSLNAAATSGLDGTEAVELLYDKENNRIGLKPVDPTSPNAYPVRPVGKGNTHLVAGSTFLNYYKIPYGVPMRYNVKFEDGILVIDLNEEGRAAPSNRSKARVVEIVELDGPDPDSIQGLPQVFKDEGALR
jgi:hypothetical protein